MFFVDSLVWKITWCQNPEIKKITSTYINEIKGTCNEKLAKQTHIIKQMLKLLNKQTNKHLFQIELHHQHMLITELCNQNNQNCIFMFELGWRSRKYLIHGVETEPLRVFIWNSMLLFWDFFFPKMCLMPLDVLNKMHRNIHTMDRYTFFFKKIL